MVVSVTDMPLAVVHHSLGVAMAGPVVSFLGFGAVVLLGFHLMRKIGQ